MKLEGLLARLDNMAAEFEQKDFEELDELMRRDMIILALVEYLNHPRIEEKIDELVF